MNRTTLHLQINLLGRPEATFAGVPLKFRSRKVMALLVYLVVTGERQSREKLADLLWPSSDMTRGMASLRNAVRRLNHGLAPAGDFILSERGFVGFDFSQPAVIDLFQLKAAISGAAPISDQIDILALYRGDFMAGFELPDAPDFGKWVGQRRVTFSQQWETLFAAVTQQQLSAGNGRSALETAMRWASHEPTSELAYQWQMKAHVLNGNRTAALSCFEQLSDILAEELGVDPSPETAALAEQIKLGSGPRAATADVGDHIKSSPMQAPFVGRSQERQRLRYCYEQALAGNPHVALITGEAGMGKSELAASFLNWATLEPSRPDIVQGRAFEMGGHLPYQPLLDGFRARLNTENAPEDLLDDVWLAELSQLLPELRGRYPDLPHPMIGNPDFVRARLFEAMATLGIALGEKRPLLFYIDDLQWADAGTLDMLLYLIQRFTAVRLPMLFIITVRQEGLLTQPSLRNWVQQVARHDALHQIDLEPLSEHALQQLVGQLAHQDSLLSGEAKALGRWLHQQTSGSPFFVMALLQTLLDQGVFVAEDGGGEFALDLPTTVTQVEAVDRIPLPPTVRDILLNRLNQLDVQTHTLLLMAAVIGRACTLDRLCEMASVDPFVGLASLETLLAARLMVEAEVAERPLTIAHDNIREVIYTEAGVSKRRLYHRQLLGLLEQDNASAAELAFHADAANLHQKSFDYAVLAGDESLAVHAFTDAVVFYEQALAVAGHVKLSTEKQCRLCTQYGRSLELNGRYQDALDHYIEINAAAQESGNKPLALATLAAQGTIYATANELSNFELGETVSKQALLLAESLDDQAAQAKIQWNLLNVYRMLGDNEAALIAGEASLRLAEAEQLKEQMAYAANDLGYVYMALGDNHRTFEITKKATQLWRELGNQPMLTDSLVNLAAMSTTKGFFEDALQIVEEPLAISQSLNNKWAQSFSLFPQIIVHRRYFDVQLTLKLLDQGIHLAEEAGFTGMQTIMGSHKAQLLMAVGAFTQARDVAQQARQIADDSIPLFSPLAIGSQLMIALAENRIDEAEKLAKQLQPNGAAPDAMNYFLPELASGCFAIAQQRFDNAEKLSREMLTLLVEQDNVINQPEFHYLHGLALVGLGRDEAARDTLNAGLNVLRETNSRLWHLEIALLLIELEEKADEGAAVAELQHEANFVLDNISKSISEIPVREAFMRRWLERGIGDSTAG